MLETKAAKNLTGEYKYSGKQRRVEPVWITSGCNEVNVATASFPGFIPW